MNGKRGLSPAGAPVTCFWIVIVPLVGRRDHQVLVAEDVLDAVRERDALDVVPVVVVVAAAQRAERMRRVSRHALKELLCQDRVSRRTALQPEGPLPLVGHVELLLGQLERRRPGDLVIADRFAVLVEQGRVRFGRDRRKIVVDDRQRTPRTGQRRQIGQPTHRELPAGEWRAVALREQGLEVRVDQIAGPVGRIGPHVLQGLHQVVAEPVGENVAVALALARGERDRVPGPLRGGGSRSDAEPDAASERQDGQPAPQSPRRALPDDTHPDPGAGIHTRNL